MYSNFPFQLVLSTAFTATPAQPILLQGTIQENLKKAADLGYDGIEVHMRPDAEVDFEAIKGAIASTGCKVDAIVTGKLFTEMHYSLVDDDEEKRTECINYMKRYIDIAHDVDADIIVGWVKGNVPAGEDKDKYLNRLAESLLALDGYADDRDVNLNIELINRYETNWFNCVDEAVEFIEKFNIKRSKIHIDTFHMNIEERDMVEAILKAKPYLGYVHFADNNRRHPGHGTIDFAAILDALDFIEYTGVVSVECLPLPSGETAAYVAREHILDTYKYIDR